MAIVNSISKHGPALTLRVDEDEDEDISQPTSNGINSEREEYMFTCNHCGIEFMEPGPPRTCGCNICDCRCAAIYCPTFDLQDHSLKYCNVLNELMNLIHFNDDSVWHIVAIE